MVSNPNETVPLAAPGPYRLFFKWPSADVKARSLDEILSVPGGPGALLEIVRWPKLEKVQPGAQRYLEQFFMLDRVRKVLEPIAREQRKARSKGIRRRARRGPTAAEREKQQQFGF